jgi:predicted KAP-like P-loop ATPase
MSAVGEERTNFMVADDVIRDPKLDELDRSSFAKSLAHSIRTMNVDSTLMFSIEGEWGSGEYSVLEFTKYYLKKREETGQRVPLQADPSIVELSPWWFSGSEDLLRQFITEISPQLRGDKRKLDKLRNLPDLLGRRVAVLVANSGVIPHNAKTALGVKVVGPVIRWLAPRKDVASLRRKIEKTLQGQTDRIVVFLDDPDRLQPQELLQVFRVVRARTKSATPDLRHELRPAVMKGLDHS